MDNPSKKIISSLLNSLQEIYLSPLSKLYLDIETLRAQLVGGTILSKTSNPVSWLLPTQHIQNLTTEEKVDWLEHLYRYLQGDCVFDRDLGVNLGKSFPYFEWSTKEGVIALTDQLGCFQAIILDEELEDELFINTVEALKKAFPSVKIYFLSQRTEHNNLSSIVYTHINKSAALETLHHINKLRLNRGFMSRFIQRVQLVLIDKEGKTVEILTKLELSKKLDEILSNYPL